MSYRVVKSKDHGAVIDHSVECSTGKVISILENKRQGYFTVGSGALGGKYRSLDEAARAGCR